jgi:nickel/cobalt exporter
VPEAGHPSLSGYLAGAVERLKEGLVLEIDGRRLMLRAESREVIFPPGAGGLPTLKLGVLYRATLPTPNARGPSRLHYRDANFPGRAGWKEIIAVVERGVTLTSSSVPEKDRSRELADYPTDLLNSPPQDLEARVVFTQDQRFLAASPAPAESPGSGRATAQGQEPAPTDRSGTPAAAGDPAGPPTASPAPGRTGSGSPTDEAQVKANKQATPRNAFTELVTTKDLGFGVIVFALAVSAALGGFHALEPGHGKTVVAAYLVGSRGTAWHAVLLGLIVTASHTAGVYLLGAVTLYASRYVVPERLYPWLGAASGLLVVAMGVTLFLRRYAQLAADRLHAHAHEHGQSHPQHGHSHSHHHDHGHHQHHPEPGGAVGLPGLVALGVSGGIVPCPAALVVLLSALSLNRVAFGLLLIVAFSIGLAAVLIAIGIVMVYAGRVMARFQGDGPLIRHWLPLASSLVITVLGAGITIQALMAAEIVQVRY